MKLKSKDEETFQLTAKGALCALMDETVDIEKLWPRFRDFVELQALREGHARGAPALVFDGAGGVCVTMELVPDEEVNP